MKLCQCELQSISSPWKTVAWIKKSSAKVGNIVELVITNDTHWNIIQMWPFSVDEALFKKKQDKKDKK